MKCEMWGIAFDSLTMQQLLDRIQQAVAERQQQVIQTVNVDHVVNVQNDATFRECTRKADIITADGMPIVWASRWFHKPLPERVTGSDLTMRLLALSSQTGLRIYFLGAGPGVAETAARKAQEQFPGCQVVGWYAPGAAEVADPNPPWINAINAAQPDVLLVAFGSPKQEKWITAHRQQLQVPILVGVGASIDFVAGVVERAPQWAQKAGLEWLYRLVKEPGRLWKRYLVRDSRFLWLLIREWRRQRFARSS